MKWDILCKENEYWCDILYIYTFRHLKMHMQLLNKNIKTCIVFFMQAIIQFISFSYLCLHLDVKKNVIYNYINNNKTFIVMKCSAKTLNSPYFMVIYIYIYIYHGYMVLIWFIYFGTTDLFFVSGWSVTWPISCRHVLLLNGSVAIWHSSGSAEAVRSFLSLSPHTRPES